MASNAFPLGNGLMQFHRSRIDGLGVLKVRSVVALKAEFGYVGRHGFELMPAFGNELVTEHRAAAFVVGNFMTVFFCPGKIAVA